MNIGLLGCGVVGGGILDFCAERADLTVAKVLVSSCWTPSSSAAPPPASPTLKWAWLTAGG